MKTILVYDINVLPDENVLTVDKTMEIYQTENILFWDSRKATPGVNCVPQIYNAPKDGVISIFDVNSEEGKASLKSLK